VPGVLRSRRARATAALVGAVCVTAAVALVGAVALTSGAGPTALASTADDVDFKYLAAEAKGDTTMLQKLQVIGARARMRTRRSSRAPPSACMSACTWHACTPTALTEHNHAA